MFLGAAFVLGMQWLVQWPGFQAARGEGGEMVVGPVAGGASLARLGRGDERRVVAYQHMGRYYYLRSVPPEVWAGTRRCVRITVTYDETDIWAAPWAKSLSCDNGFSAEVRTTIHAISPLSLRSADPLLVLPPRGEAGSPQGSLESSPAGSPALPRPL
ncbi:hypothetical protein HMPREF9946_03340 [Acetobacteraceae bacterium AT-5844]|nr:hypothetical protein HMPREF9946_03340 [Acetobacteraceae bacterium AT-5844]